MTKSNLQICSNCGAENALHEKTCKVCKHYIRASVANIDLWKTIWQIFESPTKSLTGIIHAEHKNFLIFLMVLLAVKLYSITVIFQSAFKLVFPVTGHFILNLLIQIALYSLFLIFFSLIAKIILGFRRKVRFKDSLSIIVFSFIPVILAFLILAPVQFGIFGVHWFTYNPSPFIIKNTLAYILVGLEIIMILWSLLVFIKGLYLQSNSLIFSILMFLIFIGVFTTVILFIPFVIL